MTVRGRSLQIERVSLVDAVVAQMLDAVKMGRFKPGDKIPSEKELALEFGVSRTTLREAFKRLENAGTLEIKQGNGTYIMAKEEPVVERPARVQSAQASPVKKDFSTAGFFGYSPRNGHDVSLSHYLEAREVLETGAAELAAVHADEEDLRRISGIIEMQKLVLDNPTLFGELDYSFHRALVEASKSNLLIDFWYFLTPMINEQLRQVSAIPGVNANAFEVHCAIYDALSGNSAEELRSLIIEHLRIVPGRILFGGEDNKAE